MSTATCWLKGVKLEIDKNQLFDLIKIIQKQLIWELSTGQDQKRTEDKPQQWKQFLIFLCNVKFSTQLGYPWLRLENGFSEGISYQDACIRAQTQKEIQHTHRYSHTHTHMWSWAAKEGLILRVLESDISMALSGVSMAVPCTEIIRGDRRLRRGIQQVQIYISSRVDRALPLLFPFPSFFIVTVHEAPLFSYPLESSFNTTLLPLPYITLSVTHRASFSVKMVCSLLSNSEASPSRHVSFQLFCSISTPSIFSSSEKEEFCGSPIRQPLWSSVDLCHFISDQKEKELLRHQWAHLKKWAHFSSRKSKAFLGAHISEQTPPRNLVKKFTLPQVLSL